MRPDAAGSSSAGGDATKAELYQQAEQDVPGRSSMTKDEPTEAVSDS